MVNDKQDEQKALCDKEDGASKQTTLASQEPSSRLSAAGQEPNSKLLLQPGSKDKHPAPGNPTNSPVAQDESFNNAPDKDIEAKFSQFRVINEPVNTPIKEVIES